MTALHSDYWLKGINDSSDEQQDDDVRRLVRLASARRAIANFVHILGNKPVAVEFSSGRDSYTDGETVVIAADDNPKNFDIMVGLALHEGSHVLLSNMKFLHVMMRALDNAYWRGSHDDFKYRFLPEKLHNLPNDELRTHVLNIKDILNVVEDRRIDKIAYQTAPGYRPYYTALYNHYFFTAEIGKNLRFNPKWRELTIPNYINRLLFSFHPAAKPDAMPGLAKMLKHLNLDTIERLTDTTPWTDVPHYSECHYSKCPLVWQMACDLYHHILQYTSIGATDTPDEPQGRNPNGSGDGGSTAQDAENQLPNLDGGPDEMMPTPVEKEEKKVKGTIVEVPGKYNEARGDRDVQKARDVLNGNVKKKKIKKSEDDQVKAMDDARAEMVDLSEPGLPDAACMVVHRITPEMLTQEWLPFGSGWGDPNADAIAAGRRMGSVLLHRLQVRNDPMTTKTSRLPHGGLDRRLLAQLGMDITNVFYKSRTDQHKPASLHLSLDASGSMCGAKWSRVIIVATALAFVSTKLTNVECVITVRGGSDVPVVGKIFDSRTDQFVKFINIAKKLQPNGATPEGLAFKATLGMILERTKTHDVYFINFSDGEPSFGWKRPGGYQHVYYYGEIAEKHTKAQMNKMREAGVKVLSYFIGDNMLNPHMNKTTSSFRAMYGEDAQFVNVAQATEVLRTLNKRLTADRENF